MANLRMTLLDLLNESEQGADPNFLRDGVQLLAPELMGRPVTEHRLSRPSGLRPEGCCLLRAAKHNLKVRAQNRSRWSINRYERASESRGSRG
jgi:hypothetical protein